jgi:hypothetical protein
LWPKAFSFASFAFFGGYSPVSFLIVVCAD